MSSESIQIAWMLDYLNMLSNLKAIINLSMVGRKNIVTMRSAWAETKHWTGLKIIKIGIEHLRSEAPLSRTETLTLLNDYPQYL